MKIIIKQNFFSMSPYETLFYSPSSLVFLHLPQYPRLFVLQNLFTKLNKLRRTP